MGVLDVLAKKLVRILDQKPIPEKNQHGKRGKKTAVLIVWIPSQGTLLTVSITGIWSSHYSRQSVEFIRSQSVNGLTLPKEYRAAVNPIACYFYTHFGTFCLCLGMVSKLCQARPLVVKRKGRPIRSSIWLWTPTIPIFILLGVVTKHQYRDCRRNKNKTSCTLVAVTPSVISPPDFNHLYNRYTKTAELEPTALVCWFPKSQIVWCITGWVTIP